jgi:hypothetical protein
MNVQDNALKCTASPPRPLQAPPFSIQTEAAEGHRNQAALNHLAVHVGRLATKPLHLFLSSREPLASFCNVTPIFILVYPWTRLPASSMHALSLLQHPPPATLLPCYWLSYQTLHFPVLSEFLSFFSLFVRG